ncbi:GGDEF domain-containing protein [uncultured Brevundimonas sp.]|uniref:GGDEF domain-containing protein n=1 Tax=uncultured Brevundimonas sp. TaxID=213418 RepID=UPI00262C9986|nr:GGDEF domain-containing protein [uncultured Brevundimonas sp.]
MDTVDDSPAALKAEIRRLEAEVAALRQRAEQAEALASHDVLTPALNRRGFLEVLTRQMAYCRRHGQVASLLYVDMDGFKGLNDSLGHAAGDAALIAVVHHLQDQTRQSDAVGRLGGDEFAVLLMNATLDDARAKAESMSAYLVSEGFEWDGQTLPLSASIGARALTGQSDAEVWLAEADAAMWLRKGRGRS